MALWGFLTSGSYVRCPPVRTLVAEGAPSTAYLTINGAVEKVLVRGNWRMRVGLVGPGRAFGYESLIDGRPSPVTAITRERALLLVVPRDLFQQLFNGGLWWPEGPSAPLTARTDAPAPSASQLDFQPSLGPWLGVEAVRDQAYAARGWHWGTDHPSRPEQQ